MWENSATKHQRVEAAASRKLRRLTGWNVFQREKLKDQSGLNPSEYKVQIKRLADEWRCLSVDEKELYEIQAEYEEQKRQDVRQTALPPQGGVEPEDHEIIGKQALKKLSASRLQLNFQQGEKHPVWASQVQLGDSFLPFRCQILSKWNLASQHGKSRTKFGLPSSRWRYITYIHTNTILIQYTVYSTHQYIHDYTHYTTLH